MRKKTGVFLGILVLCFLLGTPGAWGETIHVTTTSDGGAGSLRWAVDKACGNGEDDTIYLPAGTYLLSGDPGEDLNQKGDLDIDTADGITISGEGAGKTIIDGNQTDRVLDIFNGTVSISGVTIRGGKTSKGAPCGQGGGNAADGEDGGGIYNRGTLILTQCAVSGNLTGMGGECSACDSGGKGGDGAGIFNRGDLTLNNSTVGGNVCGDGGPGLDNGAWYCYFGDGGRGGGIFSSGTMTLLDSTVGDNRAGQGGENEANCVYGGNGGDGGGIYNTGTQTLDRCTITGNVAGFAGPNTEEDSYREVRSGFGGGICNFGGRTVMNHSTVSGNRGGDYGAFEVPGGTGGGIYNSGTFEMYDSSVEQNNTTGDSGAGGRGGGIYNTSSLTMERCTVRENWNGAANGFLDCDGGGVYNLGTASLTACTIAGNRAGDSGRSKTGGGSGGGVLNGAKATLEMVNCTVSGNTSGSGFNGTPGSNNAGGSGGDGGGICNVGSLSLTHCTIAGNTTGQKGGAGPYGYPRHTGHGGGLYHRGEKLTLRNTIVGNNRTPEGGEGQDCYCYSSYVTFTSGGYNLIEQVGGYTLDGDLTTMITGRDPLLVGLADNGGPVPTHALLPGSPALDSGNSFGISEDQRGYPRPVDIPDLTDTGDGSDIGAYECESVSTALPFGGFDSPSDNSAAAGSIAVTGWALDDLGIRDIKIFRGEAGGGGKVFLGSGVRVEGARTDIESGYPQYPGNEKAGWGYMLLTNALPNGGNGSFTITVEITDVEGHTVSLGDRVIHCDNANSNLPFGTIDTPVAGDTVSGAEVVNAGWALTPRPNEIPRDGSTITVWVDGQPVGNPRYNYYRRDISQLFPGYTNSDGAMGIYNLDTTGYPNGVHIIAWTVEDNAGNAAGIGSRYFTIRNSGGDAQTRTMARGMDVAAGAVEGLPVKGESAVIRVKPLERVEVEFEPGSVLCGGYLFLEKTGVYRGLPVGSSLDKKKKVFYWQPGAAFMGDYHMVFVLKDPSGEYYRKGLTVAIKR